MVQKFNARPVGWQKSYQPGIPVSVRPFDMAAELGEGPVARKGNEILFVDINTGRIIEAHLMSGVKRGHQLSEKVGAALPTTDSRYILAAAGTGLVLVDRLAERRTRYQPLSVPLQGATDVVWNDCKVDEAGLLWGGTKDQHCQEPNAAFYCADASGNVDLVWDKRFISNGIGWSPDRKWMYYIDTGDEQKIWKIPYDVSRQGKAKADMAGKTVLCQISTKPIQGASHPVHVIEPKALCPGVGPDGMCVDNEGNLYVAIWGAGVVLNLSPDADILGEIATPGCAKPTSCCLAGVKRNVLVITSAVDAPGNEQEFIEAYPDSGKIFTLGVKVPGPDPDLFKID